MQCPAPRFLVVKNKKVFAGCRMQSLATIQQELWTRCVVPRPDEAHGIELNVRMFIFTLSITYICLC